MPSPNCEKRSMPLRIYTKEQIAFLYDNQKGRGVRELTDLFNQKFGTTKKASQIKSFKGNHRLNSGLNGCFVKGSVSWNKGKKGYMGANATSFKKGQIPPNRTRLWTERISKDGYIEINVPERNPHTGFPTRYRLKHAWLWEMSNGPVPAGHALIFKDGEKQNVDLDNLLLVTRSELLSLNLHKYSEAPNDLKPAVLALAKMEAKAGIRIRPGRRGKAKRKGILFLCVFCGHEHNTVKECNVCEESHNNELGQAGRGGRAVSQAILTANHAALNVEEGLVGKR
uniref:HNH nuclease domain-containing protein n=1 Tax=Geobacter sp. (strain M21) TaxID=443144 RepID=C6E6S5_GEOSM